MGGSDERTRVPKNVRNASCVACFMISSAAMRTQEKKKSVVSAKSLRACRRPGTYMATGHSREALNTLDYVITKQGAPATLHVQVRFFVNDGHARVGGSGDGLGIIVSQTTLVFCWWWCMVSAHASPEYRFSV